jgi:hypothetical protein
MKQFCKLMAVVALALLVATPAGALDFKFGAEYRVRFYDFVNAVDGSVAGTSRGTFSDGPNTNPGGVQLRIRPRFDVSDDNGNMTATLRLEIGDIEWGNGGGANGVANGTTITNGNRVGNGSGGGLDGDGVNVETKWAYVDFASPAGIPLRWRAGLQPWYLPKGIIIDNDAAGLRAYGNASIVSYDLAWYRASGGQFETASPPSGGTGARVFCTTTTGGAIVQASSTGACPAGTTPTPGQGTYASQNQTLNTTDNNLDYLQGKVDFAIAKWLNPGLYYVYGRNAATINAAVASQQFLGVTVNGDAGILKYDLDFVYGQANGGNNGDFVTNAAGTTLQRQNVRGWMIDAGVHIPVGPVLIHAVGSYATGDKQDGGASEAFPYISPSWNGAGGLYEIPGSGGVFDVITMTQDAPTGLWMVGAGAEYRPVKALWLRFMYGFVGFSNPSANCAFNRSATATGAACYGPSYRGTGWNQTATSVNNVRQGVGGLAGKSTMGNDFELRADYDLWTNFKVQGMMGWMVPTAGDTTSKYVLQLYYNF